MASRVRKIGAMTSSRAAVNRCVKSSSWKRPGSSNPMGWGVSNPSIKPRICYRLLARRGALRRVPNLARTTEPSRRSNLHLMVPGEDELVRPGVDDRDLWVSLVLQRQRRVQAHVLDGLDAGDAVEHRVRLAGRDRPSERPAGAVRAADHRMEVPVQRGQGGLFELADVVAGLGPHPG